MLHMQLILSKNMDIEVVIACYCKIITCTDAVTQTSEHSSAILLGSRRPSGLYPHTTYSEMAQLHNQKKCSIKKNYQKYTQVKPLTIRLLAHSKHDGNDLRRDRNRGLHIRSGHPVVPVSMSMWRQVCRIDRRFERRRRHRGVSLMFVDGEGDF